jgi:hypothetical protein
MSMRKKIVSVLGVVLGVAFVFFGSGKLMGQPEVVRMFQGWGFPVWFVYATGLLVLVMLGAISTHAMHAEFGGMFPLAVAMLALSAYVALASRPLALKVVTAGRSIAGGALR